MIAGATAAIWVDREYTAQYGAKVKLSDTNTLTITPGLMGSAALALGAMFLPMGGFGAFAAGFAGGGLVYEGAKLAEDQILPLLGSPKTVPSTNAMNSGAPVAAMSAGRVPGWQVRQNLRHFRAAA